MQWPQTHKWYVPPIAALGLLCMLLNAGCASHASSQRYALFPPQEVMEQSDYAMFRTTNVLRSEQCDSKPGCEVALFNLGFVYGYPLSPYYNPAEAVRYFSDVVKKYPKSAWAAQAHAWMALLKEQQAFLPPQDIVTNEDYQRFRAVNLHVVERCLYSTRCEAALFNLGFVHAYPASPYYNPAEALRYFSDLVYIYPQTPWAIQGNMWITLLKEQYALEEQQRHLQTDLQSKETALRTKDSTIRTKETVLRTKDATIRTLQEQLDQARDVDAESGKKDMTIRTLRGQLNQVRDVDAESDKKDVTIRALQGQLEQARDIDAAIDKKERALLR